MRSNELSLYQMEYKKIVTMKKKPLVNELVRSLTKEFQMLTNPRACGP